MTKQPHPDPDSIADCVLETFDALPQKYKPRLLADGRREWVPLAGIVLSRVDDREDRDSLTCAALATGMKCLPREKVEAGEIQGNVLHDWHAEVLAIRGFNRWILDECEELVRREEKEEGTWVRWRDERRMQMLEEGDRVEGKEETFEPPFELQPNISIHMYCSQAPCGDASMELTMAEQEDATPWTTPPPSAISSSPSEPSEEITMLGRGHFDQLGIVRRKPSRPDAPITLSKSCSDKLALKQITGLLNSMTTLLVHPDRTYLSTLVLPESQHVPSAVERAFGPTGRMAPLTSKTWRKTGYGFKPFEVLTTKREFDFSKRTGAVPSNLSALYTPHRSEMLTKGVLQGRKQLDAKGASSVSRRLLWKKVLAIAVLGGIPALERVLRKETYEQVKQSRQLEGREEAKRTAREISLRGWRRNDGDERWGLD
ncbi:related to tRNA-specific adenosine deaminase 1 [Lecanosticta acicola]|uniref:Related to tRNA-specific adenosine deaminase 1 n=1 Tax=Lecanosticta acicola TaxID=111012 RepID=A0AAI8YWP1_9PEZI|nr:related to tRNA-specific adenosine deaminase 1 [Lecanosticta acicola]